MKLSETRLLLHPTVDKAFALVQAKLKPRENLHYDSILCVGATLTALTQNPDPDAVAACLLTSLGKNADAREMAEKVNPRAEELRRDILCFDPGGPLPESLAAIHAIGAEAVVRARDTAESLRTADDGIDDDFPTFQRDLEKSEIVTAQIAQVRDIDTLLLREARKETEAVRDDFTRVMTRCGKKLRGELPRSLHPAFNAVVRHELGIRPATDLARARKMLERETAAQQIELAAHIGRNMVSLGRADLGAAAMLGFYPETPVTVARSLSQRPEDVAAVQNLWAQERLHPYPGRGYEPPQEPGMRAVLAATYLGLLLQKLQAMDEVYSIDPGTARAALRVMDTSREKVRLLLRDDGEDIAGQMQRRLEKAARRADAVLHKPVNVKLLPPHQLSVN